MLTGDNIQTANILAKKIGVDKVVAGLIPDEKIEQIKNFQGNNNMVGMLTGLRPVIAVNEGEVILSSDNLVGISKAIKLSRKTLRIVKQNLFLAFVYNLMLIPLAAGSILTPFEMLPAFLQQFQPILAVIAIAMIVSSMSVVINSLRLSFD
jgi:Cu+-exporting ATPase